MFTDCMGHIVKPTLPRFPPIADRVAGRFALVRPGIDQGWTGRTAEAGVASWSVVISGQWPLRETILIWIPTATV
jgi:hypothetical protein